MSARDFAPPDAELRDLFAKTRRIAVVGFSDDPRRPASWIARYLADAGYEVVGVNPTLGVPSVGEVPVVASLRDVPTPIDLVDVFRRPDQVMPIVEDAIASGARAIWFQDGVVNVAAAERARDAGLFVVMNDCTYRQHRRLVGH